MYSRLTVHRYTHNYLTDLKTFESKAMSQTSLSRKGPVYYLGSFDDTSQEYITNRLKDAGHGPDYIALVFKKIAFLSELETRLKKGEYKWIGEYNDRLEEVLYMLPIAN